MGRLRISTASILVGVDWKMIRSVFIARNRSTGFHSLIEVVGSGDPVPAAAPMGSELAERLLRWGTLDELVEAISESGPLVDRGIYREEGRRLSISEAIEIVDGSISGERASNVAMRSFFTFSCALRGRLRRAALRRFIRPGPPSRATSRGTALSSLAASTS